MPDPKRVERCDLAPPADVITGARSVLGTIDLDPYSNKDINRSVLAARYFDRDKETLDQIVHKDWDVPNEKRVFVGAPAGAALTRRLINKTLTEYRQGRISHAVIWMAHNEAIIRGPWLWDFPIWEIKTSVVGRRTRDVPRCITFGLVGHRLPTTN